MAKSQFKGVSWFEPRKRWMARITVHSTRVSLGYFETERAAALAYDYAARRQSRVSLNLPDETIPDAIVRMVRPKLTKVEQAAKFELAALDVSDEVELIGRTVGVMWAQSKQKVPIEIPSYVDLRNPLAISDAIGASVEYTTSVTENRFKSKARRYRWIKGFLGGAKDVWSTQASVQSTQPSVRTESVAEITQPTISVRPGSDIERLMAKFGKSCTSNQTKVADLPTETMADTQKTPEISIDEIDELLAGII